MTEDFTARLGPEFKACRHLLDFADGLLQENRDQTVVVTGRTSTFAVLALYTKARKSFGAILDLAGFGYGEDALILARSILNLYIALGYICASDTERRAVYWAGEWDGRVPQRVIGSRTSTKLRWARMEQSVDP